MGKHRWSGWPGAYCMYCGMGDYLELAIGNGWFDIVTEEWDTEDHKREFQKFQKCPVVPEGVDPYSLPYPLEGENE